MFYAFFGHHKCASTWINEVLADICIEAGLRHRILVDPLTPAGRGPLTDYKRCDISRAEAGEYLRAQSVAFVTCMAADMDLARGIAPDRAFHVIRDPRDIITSAYFSHRNSHWIENLPRLAEHRERLRSVSQNEGLLLEMDYSAVEMDDLASWDYRQQNVLEVKMELLTSKPYESFIGIFEFLGLMDENSTFRFRPKVRTFLRQILNRLGARRRLFQRVAKRIDVSGEMLLGRVYDHRFEKKSGGRKVGMPDPNSHYRSGKAGDWANHFTPQHVEAFKVKFGDIVERLGYEKSANWQVAPGGDSAGAADETIPSPSRMSAGPKA